MKRKILICAFTVLLVLIALTLTACSAENSTGSETPTIAIINPTSTSTSIGFEILEIDRDNICSVTKIELLHGNDAPIELSDLTKREFNDLLADTKYTIKVTYTYNIDSEETTLTSTLDVTTAAVEAPELFIINPTSTSTSIGFEFLEIDRDNICSVTKIELLHGNDAPIELSDLTKREFNGLLADTKYTIKVTYTYNIDSEETTLTSTLDVTTAAVEAPELFIINPTSTRTGVSFDILELDISKVGEIEKIELYNGNTLVQTASNTSVREFTNLNESTKYTVKVTYKYNLNNGTGDKTVTASRDITTSESFSSKDTVLRNWAGKTLQVAATSWYAPGAPWAIPEIYIVPDSKDLETGDTVEGNKNYGDIVQDAVLERKAYVLATYGVELNYFKAGSADLTSKVAEVIQANDGTNWDILMPRLTGVHDLITAGYMYDLANREYIDFSNNYYCDVSVKTWTAQGHTFYVTGGFSFLDKQLASILYFNKDVLVASTGDEGAVEDLCRMVKDGEWVWDELVSLANGAYSDNGDGVRNYDDRFGLSIYGTDNYYQFWGIQPASVDASTGAWVSNLGNTALMNAITDNVVALATADWAYQFGSSWVDSDGLAMQEGRLLFYGEVVQLIDSGIADGNVGLVPYPMLTAAQGRYYSSTADSMVPVMGIPKITQDRAMSDYFVDVISWTGEEYLNKAYLETKANRVQSNVEIEMLADYIFPNIVYNGGFGFGLDSMDPGVISNAYKVTVGEGYETTTVYQNNYANVYAEHLEAINTKLAEMNAAWANYSDALPSIDY